MKISHYRHIYLLFYCNYKLHIILKHKYSCRIIKCNIQDVRFQSINGIIKFNIIYNIYCGEVSGEVRSNDNTDFGEVFYYTLAQIDKVSHSVRRPKLSNVSRYLSFEPV